MRSFAEWYQRGFDLLFRPDESRPYSLTSILHLFMKRLHQSYTEVMLMPKERRDEIFDMEMEIIEAEKKAAEENN